MFNDEEDISSEDHEHSSVPIEATNHINTNASTIRSDNGNTLVASEDLISEQDDIDANKENALELSLSIEHDVDPDHLSQERQQLSHATPPSQVVALPPIHEIEMLRT